MRTIIVDIISDQAEKALQELEERHLIRMPAKNGTPAIKIDWIKKYKGAMSKASPESIEDQLNELRQEWE